MMDWTEADWTEAWEDRMPPETPRVDEPEDISDDETVEMPERQVKSKQKHPWNIFKLFCK